MRKKYYFKTFNRKKQPENSEKNKTWRFTGITLVLTGICIIIYYTAPVIILQLLFKSAFADVTSPVPPPFILTPETIHALENAQTIKSRSVLPDSDAVTEDSWVLSYKFTEQNQPSVSSYTISIPALQISQALVSTVDFHVTEHLVQYWGTPVPPLRGNTVIFGHSSLPQMFEEHNYKTIFSNAYKLKPGESILVHVGRETYRYKVIKTYITDPQDVSVLKQDVPGNYLTIVTCSPPGTTWQRFIIKARLVNS